jgi:hypothetical protein
LRGNEHETRDQIGQGDLEATQDLAQQKTPFGLMAVT